MTFAALRGRLGLTLVLLLAAGPLAAQAGARWLFRSSSTADLWYHGVAVTGFTGFGAQPLYDPAYPATVRRAREARGTAATRLEREAGQLREAFVADSAFELVHFVPLYFAAAEPEEMLAALEAVARSGREAVAAQPPRARFGASTVAFVLASPAQRAVLGRFVAALREEWPVYRTERGAASEARNARLAAATATWERELEPALRGFLSGEKLDGGVVLAVPSLGPEGRLFAGQPDDRADNIVAVALPAGEPADAAAYLAVRELAFPAARRALAAGALLPPDRLAAERLAGQGSARLGGLVLGAGAPGPAATYERVLTALAGCGQGFAACFPLPGDAVRALEAAAR